ncbi:G-protein coupled receptor Mth2-like [Venturia canescens]|uniref:G-protein coupled receptor Mth2-like n=1 Tax=Venturia canescens TaxID=32260 RepID=UPI001C9C2B72|nr:G-protein coupled receptor Mth2-like [Venturia canescens]
MLMNRDWSRAETRKSHKLAWLLTFWVWNKIADAGHLELAKCCPRDQVISVKGNFGCAYYGERGRELYYSKGVLESDEFVGCDDTDEHLSVISSLDNNTIIETWPTCVDILWDEKVSRVIPIVFGCGKNNVPNTKFTSSADFKDLPNLASLSICCPSNTLYDMKQRDCVVPPANSSDIERDAVSLYYQMMEGKSAPDIVSVVRGPPKCKYAVIDYPVYNATDLRVLDDDQTLEVIVPTKDGKGPVTILANEDNSCFDSGIEFPLVRVCSGPKYCDNNPCVRKCCPEGQAMIDDGCAKTTSEQVPPGSFHRLLMNESITRGLSSSSKFMDSPDYGLLVGKPCKYGMFPVDHSENWFFTPRGEFNLSFYRIYARNEYCLEILPHPKKRGKYKLQPFVCFEESILVTEESPLRYGIFASLQLSSCFFLILTLLVYICLPSLRNLHGKTLMCHVSSLIVAYATLATVALATPSDIGNHDDDEEHSPASTAFCKFLGFTLLFSWVSAFSWLNVMCFDIWWTFGGLGGENHGPRRSRAYRKRFLGYSLYAWGLAILVTVSGIVVDETNIFPDSLRPHVGSDSCWFERNVRYYGEILFFVGPVTIQLLVNCVFFVMTAMYCSKVKAEISRVMAAPSDPRSKRFRADKTRFIMNVKLFIVMGVSWCLEIISAYLNHYAATLAWQTDFFYASDVFNCLQGVLIFILFILKKKVYQALKKRFYSGRKGHNVKPTPPTTSHNGSGLQDPFRVRNSASTSTISTYGGGLSVSTSPPL